MLWVKRQQRQNILKHLWLLTYQNYRFFCGFHGVISMNTWFKCVCYNTTSHCIYNTGHWIGFCTIYWFYFMPTCDQMNARVGISIYSYKKKRAAEDEIYINIFRFCSRIHEKFLQIANLLLWSWKVCLQEKEREGRARRGQWCDHITLRDEWFSCYLLIFNYSISRTILASINWANEAESRVKHEQMRDFWAHIAGECACMCMDYA